MIDLYWLIFLLPLAAASGWWTARRDRRQRISGGQYDLPEAYFKGLNFLLNEQHDKAIEVFIKALEVDTETVEMHLALGNLFRRRGEVERATRIHQNLIARPNLDRQQRSQALYELGQDYFKAGLFDRAENLFLELAEIHQHSEPALVHLLMIYEREKEWATAIATARKLARISGRPMGPIVAQYDCELADQALNENKLEAARKLVKSALASDSQCVRATIQLGKLEARTGNHSQAIRTLKRVRDQDSKFLGETIEYISESFRNLKDEEGLLTYLEGSLEHSTDVRLLIALIDTAERHFGLSEAEKYLERHIRSQPSVAGLDRLLEFKLRHVEDEQRADMKLVRQVVDAILEKETGYECRKCGFGAKALHWQCPGCKNWNSMEPATSSSGQKLA